MVAGGSKREKTITVQVSLNEVGGLEVTIEPYLDGELLSSQVRVVDSSVSSINIQVKGIAGKKRLDVKFNNVPKKSYVLDFDAGNYVEL